MAAIWDERDDNVNRSHVLVVLAIQGSDVYIMVQLLSYCPEGSEQPWERSRIVATRACLKTFLTNPLPYRRRRGIIGWWCTQAV